jgi:hypothetical protein
VNLHKETIVRFDKQEKENNELRCVIDLLKKKLSQEEPKVTPAPKKAKAPKEEIKGEYDEEENKSVASSSSKSTSSKKAKQ